MDLQRKCTGELIKNFEVYREYAPDYRSHGAPKPYFETYCRVYVQDICWSIASCDDVNTAGLGQMPWGSLHSLFSARRRFLDCFENSDWLFDESLSTVQDESTERTPHGDSVRYWLGIDKEQRKIISSLILSCQLATQIRTSVALSTCVVVAQTTPPAAQDALYKLDESHKYVELSKPW